MTCKDDLLHAAFLAVLQETARDEFSDEEDELEEEEDFEICLASFLSLHEQRYLASCTYDISKSVE